MEVNMVEGWKNLGAVSRGHVLRDFVHAWAIVDMTVGIDNPHDLIPFTTDCNGYNKPYRWLSTPFATSVVAT
jgi:hypothetical protein